MALSVRRSLSISAASRMEGAEVPTETACTASSVASAVRNASSSCAALHSRCSSRMRVNCSKRSRRRRHSRSLTTSSSCTIRCSSCTSRSEPSSTCATSRRDCATTWAAWRRSWKSSALKASLESVRSMRSASSWGAPAARSTCSRDSVASLICLTILPMASTRRDSCMFSSQTSCSNLSLSLRRSFSTSCKWLRSNFSLSMSFFEYAWFWTCSVNCFTELTSSSISRPVARPLASTCAVSSSMS
mmetsp:Transcript_106616/g.298524  ORF Transcript_106616/g.298524 Transcript_106616/m.298524 type:complete len:245 (+) Transcript_106616:391-1125(+)